MHKKKTSTKLERCTQSSLYTQPSTIQGESFRKQKDSFFDQSYKSSPKKPSSLTRPESALVTSIIQEKVSHLKSKFGELNHLREKLVDNLPGDYQFTVNPIKSRVKSKEMTHVSKNKAILNGIIFQTEDNRNSVLKICGSEKKRQESKIFNKAGIDKLLFGTENSFTVEDELVEGKTELDQAKIKIKIKERELVESERVRKILEKQVAEKDKKFEELEEKYKSLLETNKSLKVKVNRLENEMKNSEKTKIGKKKTIENLSYIILSKDCGLKEEEVKGESKINSKYVETLNELYSSDKLAVEVLNKLRKNQTKEAFLTLLDKEDAMNSRLEQTQASILEIESGISSNTNSASKSPLHPKKSEESQIKDLNSFVKCQATLIEELLGVI